jgi:DNA-binding NarL/FixJ family response regulator
MIRVFLVENELLVRKGLRSLLELEPELAIAGEATDGAEALAALAARDIADVLLDLRMPRMGGLELLRELRRLGRATPCLILTTFRRR